MRLITHPPTHDDLTLRAWAVLHIASRVWLTVGWVERKRFVRRALFIRHLISTGRLTDETSASCSDWP